MHLSGAALPTGIIRTRGMMMRRFTPKKTLNFVNVLPKSMIVGQLGRLSASQKKSIEQKLKKLFGL